MSKSKKMTLGAATRITNATKKPQNGTVPQGLFAERARSAAVRNLKKKE
tara:strand:- start:1399 stop:1545 length:147 start_codon:yes stop_codon:yes gene_type:complete